MISHADLIGAPFKYSGRGPKAYDCYGLVMEMKRREGNPVPDFGFSMELPVIATMMAAVLPQWREIEKRPGAICLFRIKGLGAHVGYTLSDDRFIHVWEKSGGVLTERFYEWKRRTIGFFEYAGPQ